MLKRKLKTGMVVETAGHNLLMVIREGPTFIAADHKGNWIDLKSYTSDLKYLPNLDFNYGGDIIAVYSHKHRNTSMNMSIDELLTTKNNLECVFQRNKPIKMTKKEIESKLGHPIEIID